MRRLTRIAPLLALLALAGCDVALTLFAVPLEAAPGATINLTIAGNIAGTTGRAGCVLQLPLGWTVLGMTNNHNWPVTTNEATLLANYTAEPGHYLVGASGTGTGGIGGGQTLSEIAITVAVLVPPNANGIYHAKLSLAGMNTTGGTWAIQEPANVAQFAQITAAPYSRPIYVGVPAPVDFAAASSGLPTPAASAWTGVAFGDIDGDGNDDLAAASFAGTPRCWLARPGPSWVESSAGLGTSTQGAQVALGQLDGDGLLDLVDGNGNVYYGNGGTGWTQGASLPLAFPSTTYSGVAIGDVDGDGRADVAIGNGGNGTLRVLHNNGNRTFTNASAGLPATPATSSDSGGTVHLVDLDGDGDLDLLWERTLTPNLWLGDGAGNWSPGVGIPGQLRCATTGDLDGDGVPEILVGTSSAGSGVTAYKRAFGISWAPLPIAGLPSTTDFRSLRLLDFDRDGRLDLIGGHPLSTGGIDLWRNTGAGFALRETTGLPTLVAGDTTLIATGDFDGNTFPDLAVITAPLFGGSYTITAWQNRRTGVVELGGGCAGGTFAEPTLTALGAPALGNSAFAMQVHEAAPGTPAIFWFGGSRTFAAPFSLPLDVTPFGAPGCTVWASLDFTFFGLLDAGGTFTTALPVPNVPALQYATAFAQGGVFATSANTFGMLFTRGTAVRIE